MKYKFDELVDSVLFEKKGKKKKKKNTEDYEAATPVAKDLASGNFKGGAIPSKKDKKQSPKKQRQEWKKQAKDYY